MAKQKFYLEKTRPAPSSDLLIRSSLPQWVVHALRQGGIKRMSVISALSDQQLLQIPGIGNRSLALIRSEVRRMMEVKTPSATRH